MYPTSAMLNNMDVNHHNMYKHYEDCYPLGNCRVSLKNAHLWKEFHELGTEMIITKSGRRMFPSLHVQITDLDPNAHYCILLEMAPVSHCRFRYSNAGGWAPAGTEEAQSPQRVYLHPDSPATGEYWMSQPVSFGRLKLTNTIAPPAGHVVLSSMHKYQPRILICKTSDSRNIAWAPSVSKVFPETQFIAVTAYQNERITKLKIDNNPFAKGFRENGQAKCKRKRNEVEDKEEVHKAKQMKVERLSPLKLEDDRLSSSSASPVSSGPCSPETSHRHPGTIPGSPGVVQSLPGGYQCPSSLPTSHSMLYNPYYYPYSVYPPVMWGIGGPTTMYYSVGPFSPPQTKNLVVVGEDLKEKPRKLTDFSIRAITGCS